MKQHLVYYGNEILRQKAEEIVTFDQELSNLVEGMFSIMKKANGIGLAAPQINISKQLFVVDTTHAEDGRKIALINPKIVWKSDDNVSYEEGCLSIPGIFEEVYRPSQIVIQGYSPEGKEVEYKAEGLLARVMQHEFDHLKGILFIDYLEDYIRKEFTKELKKIKKLNKAS